MKKLLLAFIILMIGLPSVAYVPEKTHVFQGGKTIRASELNQNDDDFFNALTDGEADLRFASVSASSLVADSFTYRSNQTISKFISFAQFGQVSNNVTNYVMTPASGYGRLTTSTNAIVAPLILPHGAVITSVVPSMSSFVWVTMNRIPSNNGTASAMVAVSGNTAITSITNSTVDNNGYSYVLVGQATSINKDISYIKVIYTTTYLRMN